MEANLWFERVEKEITVGITQDALSALGAIESVDGFQEGERFEVGQAIMTITGTDGKLVVNAPTSGFVHVSNEDAQRDIESGLPSWLLKITSSNN